jgi:hypothetical protein
MFHNTFILLTPLIYGGKESFSFSFVIITEDQQFWKTKALLIALAPFIGLLMIMVGSVHIVFADPLHCDQPGWPSCLFVGYADGQGNSGLCPSGHSLEGGTSSSSSGGNTSLASQQSSGSSSSGESPLRLKMQS